ncbi:MAG: hypothetical protein IID12_00600 [Candidatus Marinimicrobia bacterium]|nr:hypothetical protein [Candidatus Neomarinimicrobiota bacterium]
MDSYVIYLIWAIIITSLGIYWHTLKISQNVRKIVEHLTSKGNDGS